LTAARGKNLATALSRKVSLKDDRSMTDLQAPAAPRIIVHISTTRHL
jgi:hypothetical protein